MFTKDTWSKMDELGSQEYIGTIKFLNDYQDIRQSFFGSPVASSEAFVKRLYKAEPRRAALIADDIEKNITAAIQVSGLPVTALRRIVRFLRGGH